MSSATISEGTQISSGTFTGKMDALATVGCFATPAPLVDHGSYIYQSSGNCQKICYQLGMPVMGLTGGTNCSCGNLLPPKDGQVDDSECSTTCVGYNKESCGGADLWWVILTGYSQNAVQYLNPESISSASSSSSSSHKAQASVVTVGGSTVRLTVDPADATQNVQDPSATAKQSSGGSNTVGIAVGVVVGVLVLAALIGGVLLFLRRRQSRLAQAEYDQKQSVQQFVARGKGYSSNSQTSAGDSRLDPEVMLSRRQSDGSIMDNQDYSRRILQVTN